MSSEVDNLSTKKNTYKSKTTDWDTSSSKSKSDTKSKSNSNSKSKSNSDSDSNTKTRSSSNIRTASKSDSESESESESKSSFDELKMPQILPKKLNYSEKIAKKMKKTFQQHEKILPFSSSFQLCNLFYLYLFKKYKMDCIISGWQYGVDLRIDLRDTDPIINTFWDSIIEQISEKIISCILNGSKIIIIPFIFDIIIDQQSKGSHSNLLIYRQNTGQMEHFEPHGPSYEGNGSEFITDQINAFLKRFVQNLNSLIKYENRKGEEKIQKIKLISAYDVCPDKGLQTLEEGSEMPRLIIEPQGYCAAWSMFFTELCLKNPERSSRDIYDAIMERTELYEDENTYLRNVIHGYISFINNKLAKHFSRVFDESGFIENIDELTRNLDYENPEKNNMDELERLSIYRDKMLEIMEIETGIKSDKETDNPDVRSRYNEFTEGIRSETSSSSYKSRGSPTRKHKKKKKKGTSATRKSLFSFLSSSVTKSLF
jgi:hypothetical protein